MLIGTINKGYEQIHIKEYNGKVSFIKVNDKVSCLTKEEALDVLKDIFNTNNLKYLESNNEYDIYLDLANNKRYFKNGIEDFRMFYDNNGQSAILYSKGSNFKDAIEKTFQIFLTIGIYIPIILTSDGIDNFLVNYKNINNSTGIIEEIDNSDIASTITEEIPDYEYTYDIEQIKKYIMESDGLSEFDKKNIYNEEYLNFLFRVCDDQSKLYDIAEKTKNISVVMFNDDIDEGHENSYGYYSHATNTIHLQEYLNDDLREYASTEAHEYIHLTQTFINYRYINEALAEMLSAEFYGNEIESYTKAVKNVKKLIELIGPDAVLNATYSYDTTKFENAVKEYLNEEDVKTFFTLLDTTKMYDYEDGKIIDDYIELKIDEMLSKKFKDDKNQINLINKAAEDTNKFYFNNNHENYYTKVSLDIYVEEKITNTVAEYLLKKGQPNNIEIYEIDFNKNQFLTNINEIKDYLSKHIVSEILINEKIEDIDEKNYEKYSNKEKNSNISYTGPQVGDCDLLIKIDENNNFICNDVIVSDEELISIINEYNELECIIKQYISFTWDEFKNELPSFIYDKQYKAYARYLDSDSIYINYDTAETSKIDTIKLPPISEEFDIEYLNKSKSK